MSQPPLVHTSQQLLFELSCPYNQYFVNAHTQKHTYTQINTRATPTKAYEKAPLLMQQQF